MNVTRALVASMLCLSLAIASQAAGLRQLAPPASVEVTLQRAIPVGPLVYAARVMRLVSAGSNNASRIPGVIACMLQSGSLPQSQDPVYNRLVREVVDIITRDVSAELAKVGQLPYYAMLQVVVEAFDLHAEDDVTDDEEGGDLNYPKIAEQFLNMINDEAECARFPELRQAADLLRDARQHIDDMVIRKALPGEEEQDHPVVKGKEYCEDILKGMIADLAERLIRDEGFAEPLASIDTTQAIYGLYVLAVVLNTTTEQQLNYFDKGTLDDDLRSLVVSALASFMRDAAGPVGRVLMHMERESETAEVIELLTQLVSVMEYINGCEANDKTCTVGAIALLAQVHKRSRSSDTVFDGLFYETVDEIVGRVGARLSMEGPVACEEMVVFVRKTFYLDRTDEIPADLGRISNLLRAATLTDEGKHAIGEVLHETWEAHEGMKVLRRAFATPEEKSHPVNRGEEYMGGLFGTIWENLLQRVEQELLMGTPSGAEVGRKETLRALYALAVFVDETSGPNKRNSSEEVDDVCIRWVARQLESYVDSAAESIRGVLDFLDDPETGARIPGDLFRPVDGSP